jgi:hypothetical protein
MNGTEKKEREEERERERKKERKKERNLKERKKGNCHYKTTTWVLRKKKYQC